MTPAARIAAAIELLSEIEEAIAGGGLPADRIIQSYFRERRYAGSKDRRTVTTLIYEVLRNKELVRWIAECVELDETSRSSLFIWLYVSGHEYKALITDKHPYGTEPASADELSKLALIDDLDTSEADEAIRLNLPAWAMSGAEKRFGSDLSKHAIALNREAGVTLRTNPLKTGKKTSQKTLETDLKAFEKNQFSALAYRAATRVNVSQTKSFKEGLIEVQDEAAQIASLLVGAKPDETVIDLCAGAGGKALLVAATMKNSGRLFAFDTVGRRLQELSKRAKRAGAANIKSSEIPLDAGERAIMLESYEGKADKVIVDVPCTGSGTWRRSPDLRWRYDENSLSELNEVQKILLSEGAKLTKIGGRVFYMTCSILPAENEDVVQSFLSENSDWKLLNYKDNWTSDYLSGDVPESDALVPECLQLTPHSHATDGFFIAILERTA